MSRRLLNRSGHPAASSSSSTSTALPEYQEPSCPLNDLGRRALGDLSNNRGTVVYQVHLKDSVRLIGSGVGDLHERLREQQTKLQNARARREEKGTEKTPEEERLEKHVEDLEHQVNSLTDKSEQAIRDLIDRQAELEDEGEILGDLHMRVAPPTEDGEPSGPSARDLFNKLRAEKELEYSNMTLHRRYALNNDYAHFKKVWHDSMAGEEGPPLPDASRWFRDDKPVMRIQAEAEDEDEDDDIAVAREVLSINCPLTLQPMNEPYSNRKCKHTFEKAAILDYLSMRGEKQCPQTGCSRMFSRAGFDQDFFLDQAMVRRIRRARQAQEQQELEEEDEEDDDDEDVMVRGHKAVPGRVPKQERV
ncbi:zinc-finger of the MIZ type in Nse subunit-domain-containing protein [Thelonectria olida]|uniref:Zinc-finger of the MIZ type in Nse subunit-domain-containing protein n=1 Tax=Thelonectria olida TaxID=1576542 RepID=A0A9P8WCQ1_9HYPO|nr:zinc-finger of the MIZ type in Nse subunit-domain-containing protein [Thelonectria olida]